MPRKAKLAKHQIVVRINDIPITVHLHPPTGRRSSWYAFWTGLETSRSTGQADLAKAMEAAESMIKNQGKKPTLTNAVMSDEEFEKIQRTYFERKSEAKAKQAAERTLEDCLEAIDAFRRVSKLVPITLATADHCARFQREALSLPKNWRKKHPNSKQEVDPVSANTVLKWCRQLMAAWNRVNRNAGKKCVRGIVDQSKLLADNPWTQFDWIEGKKKEIRQLDHQELVAVLDAFGDVPVAATLIKTLLWSWCRREEATGLRWDSLREVDDERHFEVVGKHGVEKWFRVPSGLFQEMLANRRDSPYVFAAYSEQLRKLHLANGRQQDALMVHEEFDPDNLGYWMHNRLEEWSAASPKGKVTFHTFRKTTMQYARAGEDINRSVAADIRVSASVMMTNYVKETDVEMRAKSNRVFARIVAYLPQAIAARYGHAFDPVAELKNKIKAAVDAGDLDEAARLLAHRL